MFLWHARSCKSYNEPIYGSSVIAYDWANVYQTSDMNLVPQMWRICSVGEDSRNPIWFSIETTQSQSHGSPKTTRFWNNPHSSPACVVWKSSWKPYRFAWNNPCFIPTLLTWQLRCFDRIHCPKQPIFDFNCKNCRQFYFNVLKDWIQFTCMHHSTGAVQSKQFYWVDIFTKHVMCFVHLRFVIQIIHF